MADPINWHGDGMSAIADQLPREFYLVRGTMSGHRSWKVLESEETAIAAAEGVLGEVQLVRLIEVKAERLDVQTEIVRKSLVPVGTAVSS